MTALRYRVFALTIALAAASLESTIATAQSADPLASIVEEALRNNLGLAQENLKVARAGASVREARGRFLPSLTLDSRYSEQDGVLNLGDLVNPAYAALNRVTGENRFPTDLNVTLPMRHESRLRLVQPVFDASILAGHSLARHERDGQESERNAAARRLAADAQTAYLDVASARSARRIWESTLGLVTENERVAERLLAAGRATPDAVFRARADRSDVEQQLAEAGETEAAAARSFNQILRRPLDTAVELVPDSLLRFALDLTEEQAMASALTRREELAQANAGIDAAKAGIRLATASFLPSVNLALDYGYQGRDLSFRSDDNFTVLSVVLSWNLFNGGRDAARRQGAQIEAERLQLARLELEDRIRLDVRQAYQGALVARGAIATAEARLAAAERSFQLIRRRYQEGLATQVELLDARTAYTNAELNRVQTVYRYAARYVDLERAAALRHLPIQESQS
jgi:outer membrane protein TolC